MAHRILIVEDNAVLRQAIASYIRAGGLHVAEAGSLAEAKELLDRGHFDALVLDVGLPDGDGLSLLPRTSADRALVITGQPDPERFERAGVRHHLAKPLDLPTLRHAVEMLASP